MKGFLWCDKMNLVCKVKLPQFDHLKAPLKWLSMTVKIHQTTALHFLLCVRAIKTFVWGFYSYFPSSSQVFLIRFGVQHCTTSSMGFKNAGSNFGWTEFMQPCCLQAAVHIYSCAFHSRASFFPHKKSIEISHTCSVSIFIPK